MEAIEFEAIVSKGQISLPAVYSSFENQRAKVILLFPEENRPLNFNREALLSAFKRAHSANVFNKISDSVNWQKQERDEWE